jgi:hypothetical protein
MANYAVHVGGGVVGSALFTTATYFTGLLDFYSVPLLFGAGVLGSIFPDVDSDHSTPIKIIFRILTLLIIFGFLYLFEIDKTLFEYGLLVTIIFIAVIYLTINKILKVIFKKFTVHRSIFHSILAAVVFQGLLVVVLSKIYGVSEITSCFAGVSFFVGYLIHLSLDEISSVDFTNAKLKQSHGTALKLADLNSGIYGLIKTLIFVAIGYWYILPNLPNPIIADINSKGLAVPVTKLKTEKLKFYDYRTPKIIVKSIRFIPKDGKLDDASKLLNTWYSQSISLIKSKIGDYK